LVRFERETSAALFAGERAGFVPLVAASERLVRSHNVRSDTVFAQRLLDRVALNRVAQPEEIAKAALFLASPDAGYITGAILPVDGGTSASSGTPRPQSINS
jgi:NAD(P)-dependent dehydrogenase (short-subunit alcohol dehydrogenase family)